MSSLIPTEHDIISVMPENEWLTVKEIAEKLSEFPAGFVKLKLKKMLRSQFYKIIEQDEDETLQYMRYHDPVEFAESVAKIKHTFAVIRERTKAREATEGGV